MKKLTFLLVAAGVATALAAVSSKPPYQGAGAPKMDRTKLLVGTYYLKPYAQTEQHVADLKACGIDFVFGIGVNEKAALDLLAKHGVGVIASGACPGWFGGNGKNAGTLAKVHPMAEYDKALSACVPLHPAVWMADIGDEPSALDYATLGAVAKKVGERTGLTPYLNLYPNYAMVAKNGGKEVISQLGTPTYAEYLEQYAKKVPLDYLSYDFYVYSAPTSRPNSMIAKFYENLRNAADVCRRTNRSLWVIPQVNSRIPDLWMSENMLRFQANQCLAFGTEVINWACYTAGWWTNQVVDCAGRKTRQYERLKKVNAELHALGPAYMRYRNTDTRLVGFGPEKGDWFVKDDWKRDYKGAFARAFDNGFFREVRLADAAPVTIGEMVSRDGAGKVALFAADASDPWDRAKKPRELVFRCAGAVSALSGTGAVKAVRDADGLWHVPLAPCGGVLVTAEIDAKAEPRWALDNAATQRRFHIQQGERVAERNRLVVFPSGHDVIVHVEDMETFPAAARPFFAMRYRAVTKKQVGGLFFTTEALPSFCDDSFSPFGVNGDGAWHTLVVDMRTYGHGRWKGRIRRMRLDPLNPSEPESEFDLARMGFFATRAEAERFCGAADASVAFTQGLTLSGPTYRALVPPEALQKGWRRESFALSPSVGAAFHRRPPPPAARLMVCRDGKPVPCHVNSRGFAFYRADLPGVYTLAAATEAALPLAPADSRALGCDVTAPFPRSYFTRERIRLGGWGLFGDTTFRERKVRDFAECGMDFLIANTLDSSVHRANLLRACNAAGVEVILSDGTVIGDPEHAGMDCADQPSYSGHQLRDEPGSDDLPALGRCAARYAAASGRLPFINLLPMYANAAQLKYGQAAAAIKFYDSDPDLYRKHCECFCTNVAAPYLCTDIYPLGFDANGKRTIYRDYVESINVAADVARKHGREFWCYVLCYPYRNEFRGPSAAEIRWQCYSMLSFGCRNILAWIYYHLENYSNPGLVTREGERTAAWYNTRTAFREVRAISDVYCRYRNLGAFTHNCSAKTPYLRMTNELKGFAPIRKVMCSAPLLIGCFEGKADPAQKAFTLVNMNNLDSGDTVIVALDLGGARALVYRKGQPEAVAPDADGLTRIPLELGEGVFVTLPGRGGVPPPPAPPPPIETTAVGKLENRTKDPSRDPGLFGDYWWANRFLSRHRQIEALRGQTVDLVMLGDSIIHFWEWKHPQSWKAFCGSRKVLNLGYGGDRTENVIWRIEHGELDGYTARRVVVMIGTNNNSFDRTDPANVAKGIEKIVALVRAKQPKAEIVLHPIFPRGNGPTSKHHAAAKARNDRTNALLASYAKAHPDIRWIDFNDQLVDASGWVPADLMADQIHPTDKGYAIWSSALPW